MQDRLSEWTMKHDYDKILTRLTVILQRLYEGETLSVSALAEEFNVGPKTIQRDFNECLTVRFPIEKEGKGWKTAVPMMAFLAILVMTNSFAAAFVLSAGLYIMLRWPRVVLIIVGIDALRNRRAFLIFPMTLLARVEPFNAEVKSWERVENFLKQVG